MSADITVTVIDGVRVVGPEDRGARYANAGRWRVSVCDPVTEELSEKTFSSRAKALAFIASLYGEPATDPLAQPHPRDGNTTMPGVPLTQLAAPAPPQLKHDHVRSQRGEKRDGASARFNLGAVAAVLERYQLDPFAEVARVLMHKVPLVRRDGTPVIDPETGDPVMVDAVGGIDRAKICVELGQYVAPKLKAVEMKVEDRTKLSDAEIDERINAALAKLGTGAALPPREEGA